MDLFTAPWPGPGNSDGPVDPEGWRLTELLTPDERDPEVVWGVPFVVDSPWPGPGDSDGEVEV
ncbi:MAG TPA: hypothetical protein VEQ37_02165 [Actinomycetota bacterium]|nr:hypothetical protein [Actinomycetota bacterium]